MTATTKEALPWAPLPVSLAMPRRVAEDDTCRRGFVPAGTTVTGGARYVHLHGPRIASISVVRHCGLQGGGFLGSSILPRTWEV